MNIIAIAANYYQKDEPRIELPEHLMIFTKPESSITNGNTWQYPSFSNDIFSEMELVLKINKKTSNISKNEAMSCFDEIAIGMDWTAMDILKRVRKDGFPWTFAKGFDGATFLSDFIPTHNFTDIHNIDLRFEVNQHPIAAGNTSQLKADCTKIISYTSQFMTLYPGDLIMTGAIPNPHPAQVGDHCCGYINNQKLLDFIIT